MVNRSLKIDTLRGIACVLLVTYHVIGSNPSNGLKIETGFYREINDILAYLRMPLFTFLSGIVYGYRPFQSDSLIFMKKKARRLLFPMLTVGTFYAILQSLIPGTNASIDTWYLLHIKPVAHFWFVESLFTLFLLIVICEKKKLFNSVYSFSIILLAVSFIYLSPFDIHYFSLNGVVYLAPYFLLGMGVQRYKLILKTTLAGRIPLILVTIVAYYLAYNSIITINGSRSLLGLLLGFISCLALFSSGLQLNLFGKIGLYSYSIYLFHVFFTAGTRILLSKIGISQLEIFIIVSAILGVIGPIIVELILSKTSYAKMFFLGKPPSRTPSLATNIS